MYGTIRKNYSARRPAEVIEEVVENSYKEKARKEKKKKREDDLQQTRYMKVDYTSHVRKDQDIHSDSEPKKIFKNEFPVASVILTIVVTMMVMVFAFGFGGI